MGWGTINVGSYTFSDSAGVNLTPTDPGHNTGDLIINASGEFIGSDTQSTPSGYTLMSPNVNAKQIIVVGRIATSSSDAMATFNWASHGAWAIALTIPGGPASITGIVDVSSDRQSTSTTVVSQTGGSVTPANANCLVLRFGNFVKTSARDSATITPPSNFTHLTSLIRSGNVAASTIEYWLQTTATTIPINGAATSTAESTAQNYEGVVIALIPGVPAPNALLGWAKQTFVSETLIQV